ncbi:MAG: hypothetical protein IKE28_04470 [Solobacterium sp.]|nr:hypothetical protein [Solobacterium sp.]
MNKIIVYGSCYGATRRYAEALSEKTGIPAVSYENVEDINSYKTIIYMGGLYAGGVQGMKQTLKHLSDLPHKNVMIVTVGLADPTDPENIETIRSKMKSQLSKELFEQAQIFHLRGGIDYAQLSFLHKTMMSMVYRKAVNLPEEQKNAEVQAMIETYNKQVDFTNFNSLEPILQALSQTDTSACDPIRNHSKEEDNGVL